MHDQADQLRKLVRTTVQVDGGLAPGGPIIAVSGGQLGVGATTVACGLACELARLGKQVVLIDANIQRPTIPSASSGTLHDVLTGQRRAIEVLAPSDDDGLRLLAGCPKGAMPPLDRDALARFAAEAAALSRQVDVVLIDAGHGMNAWIDRLWQLAREVLLVSTLDAQSIVDSYAAVKLAQFHRLDDKLRLALNRADESETTPLANRFSETCEKFLMIKPKSAISLPAFSGSHTKAGNDARATAGLSSSANQLPGAHCWTIQQRRTPDEQFQRAVRLLAANLVADFRVASQRLLRPNQPSGRDGCAKRFNHETHETHESNSI